MQKRLKSKEKECVRCKIGVPQDGKYIFSGGWGVIWGLDQYIDPPAPVGSTQHV
jgi:hypothetical protein